jgi:hypothetical protein
MQQLVRVALLSWLSAGLVGMELISLHVYIEIHGQQNVKFYIYIWNYVGGIFQKRHASPFPLTHLKNCKFGCQWSTIKGTLLEKMCPSVCISATIRGIFLIFHISHRHGIRYKRCTFGFDQSTFKRTLPGKQRTFSAISRLSLEGASWNITPRTFHACAIIGVSLSWSVYN